MTKHERRIETGTTVAPPFPVERQSLYGQVTHLTRVSPTNEFVPFEKEEIEQSIPERFEKIVRLHSNRIAIKADDQVITYAELNAMANRLAHAIVAERGSKPGPVALLLEKGISLTTGMLGVLKAGKYFVLLDPSFPKTRTAEVLQDSQSELILTDKRNLSLLSEAAGSGCRLVEFDSVDLGIPVEDLRLPIAPDALAFITYTSGSTGQPKGVIQNHRNLLHDALLRTNIFHICKKDKITLLSSGTSNAVKNACFTLLNGAALLPFDVQQEGVSRLASWLARERISICRISSPLFRRLCETLTPRHEFPDLRLIQLASEKIYKSDIDLYKRFFSPKCILSTGLASSETGLLREYLIDHETEIAGNDVPIGYPVAGKESFLVNDAGREIGFNEVGEIVVRSEYLSPGYWRRTDLTEAKFKPDPEGTEKHLYFTGDLGLMLPDGCLIHKGRKDFRVKVRGYGVEIAEVEKTLRAHQGINETVVVAKTDEAGEARLVAYCTSVKVPSPTVSELRRFLNAKLPHYMIPSAFIMLETLPLAPNGKVDRRLLPDPEQTKPRLEKPLVAAKTPVEQTLAGIWAEVLGLERVGIHDDFFELGGHSLMGAGIISRLNETLGLDLPLRDLFESPTVAQLARRIEGRGQPAQDPQRAAVYNYLVTLSRAPGDKRVFCFPYRGGFRNEYFNFTRISRYFTAAYSFYGLHSPAVDGIEKSLGNVKEIAADYVREIRGFQPHGPYYLIGECGGGILAYEAAQQLQEQGQDVPLLVLFDTEAWSWGSSIWRRFTENRLYRRRFNVPRRRYHTPWIWSYLHARIKLHLSALRRLEGSHRLRYFLDKAARAAMAVPYSLQRVSSVRRPAASANRSDASGQTSEYLERAEKAYFLAAHRHRYRRYPGRIALLVNEQWHASEPTLGWTKFAAGGLDVYKIPGNHDNCIPDNIPLVAKLLAECLAKAEGNLP